MLTSLPGVGPRLAEQLQDRLGIKTLEELEWVVRDGRLAEPRIGPKRLRGILHALAVRFPQGGREDAARGEPEFELLLTLDADFRDVAERDELPRPGPRCYFPGRHRWVPFLNDVRGGWKLRASLAESALAHRLGRTRDWVMIRFENSLSGAERTVLTEVSGDLRGLRVVRGRERECRAYYGQVGASPHGPNSAA